MDLKQELSRARHQTEVLFSAIDPAALYDRPIAERHRMIFYLGHLEAFDWNQMNQSGVSLPSHNPAFDKLFEFGIDPEPGQLPSDQPKDWPSIAEVARYNAVVRQSIDRHFNEIPVDVAHMMVEHRHMHAETFAYIVHSLDYEKKKGPAPHPSQGETVRPEMIEIPAGEAALGRNHNEGFGWDNEFCAHTVYVPEFSIGKYKVSNGEYLTTGASATATGSGAECLARFLCRSIGQSTPRSIRPGLMPHIGELQSPPKRNTTARALLRSSRTRISITGIGTLFPSRPPKAFRK
jgi:hypothetical protein